MAFDLHYAINGDGTPSDPTDVRFAFTQAPRPIKPLRAQLPYSVTLEETGFGSFTMTGRYPGMTRQEIIAIWHAFVRGNTWVGKYHP